MIHIKLIRFDWNVFLLYTLATTLEQNHLIKNCLKIKWNKVKAIAKLVRKQMSARVGGGGCCTTQVEAGKRREVVLTSGSNA